MRLSWGSRLLLPAILLVAGMPLHAQRSVPPVLSQVRIDQRLNGPLPLETEFRDESGRAVRLRDYFGDKPVILTFAYYTCPMLCPMMLEGMMKVLRITSLEFGRDFIGVNISINSRETPEIAAAKKAEILRGFEKPGANDNWHFLTGDELAIQKAADAAGFRFVYDPATEQFIHASGIMIVTPDGKMSRYFYGIEFAERDVRLGLVEAARGRIGSRVDQVLLFCFHYDPQTGKYGLAIMNVIRLIGTVTVLLLVVAFLLWLRRERRHRHAATHAA